MLKNGLNIKKKENATGKSHNGHGATKLSAFADDNSDEEVSDTLIRQGKGLSQSSLRKMQLDENDAVYDYDGLYDSMKSGEQEATNKKELDKKERKPKYMQNLFEMAEVRKRDRLRAEDFKLQREREAEGDEYSDKEKFVTSAYRAQQEELKRLEAEEAVRESRMRSRAGGFSIFNQNIMESDQKKHDAAVQASLKAERARSDEEASDSVTRTQAQVTVDMIREAEAKLGHKIAVNDDNQIVDHRQLLGAGLNRPTKSAEHLQTAKLAERARPVLNKTDREERQAQIERQQRLVEQQLNDSKKREADAEAQKQDAIIAQAKRTKTDSQVMSAKERYLARKRAEAEAKAKAAENGPSLDA